MTRGLRMDRRAFVAAALGAGFLPAAARAQEADAAADELIAPILAETGAPALAGAVVTRDGFAWLGAGGVRRAGGTDKVTVEDQWHLGSNTKAMTAALYARLAEQGRAKWGAGVAELFPKLKTDPAWSGATIQQFMAHRAGLSDKGLIDTAWLIAAQTDPRPLPDQRRAFVAKALGAKPGLASGTYEYANADYVLAGAAIERVSGLDWESAIRTELFSPLGIEGAGFGAPDGDQPWGHLNGVAVDPMQLGADNPAAMGPAGTVHMSLEDYARFLRVFLTDGGELLQPSSVATLTTPWGGQPNAYALGWGTLERRQWANGPVLTHSGSNNRWMAVAMVAPARGLAFVTVSNDRAKGEKATQALLLKLIDRFARA
ncbi:beta-lactamase family protein [Caulobacter sp. 17J80-11]|nr:beta-lactamase family protein [Caulobacter sp. 17J80-11]